MWSIERLYIELGKQQLFQSSFRKVSWAWMESLVKKCPLENSLYETKLSYYSITALHLEVGVCLYQCSTNQVLAFNRVRFESFRVLCKFDINHVLSFDLNPSQNTQFCNWTPLCSTFTFENVRSPKKKSLPTIFNVNLFFESMNSNSNLKKNLPFKPMTEVTMAIFFGCELRSSNVG
jgi:hypothetical protein